MLHLEALAKEDITLVIFVHYPLSSLCGRVVAKQMSRVVDNYVFRLETTQYVRGVSN